jgi:general secretion pathway protein J
MILRLRQSTAGFTLAELLVALALLALIAVYLASAFGTGRRVWEIGKHIESQEEVTAAREFLRRQIEAAWPALEPTSEGAMRLKFSGTAEQLRFVTHFDGAATWAGLYDLMLARSGNDLAVTGDLARLEKGSSPASFDRILMAGVQDVHFAYFGRVEDEAEPAWHSNWPAERGLPRLIRISIGFPQGDSRHWSELVVAPRLARRP